MQVMITRKLETRMRVHRCIGDLVKALKESPLPYKEICKRAGVSESAFYNMKTHDPRLSTLEAFAGALGYEVRLVRKEDV